MFRLIVGLFVFQVDYMDMLSTEYIQTVFIENWPLSDHIRGFHANLRAPVSKLIELRIE